jgi:sulfate adenylyltransferase subunit 2
MLPFLTQAEKDSVAVRPVRCRTLGCYPQTGAVRSDAQDVKAIVQELLLSKTSEREGRMLDKDQVGSMEQKKREGYF